MMAQQLTILEWIDSEATKRRDDLSQRRRAAVTRHRPVKDIDAELRRMTDEQLRCEVGLSR